MSSFATTVLVNTSVRVIGGAASTVSFYVDRPEPTEDFICVVNFDGHASSGSVLVTNANDSKNIPAGTTADITSDKNAPINLKDIKLSNFDNANFSVINNTKSDVEFECIDNSTLKV